MYALIAQRGSDHSVPLSKESKTFNDMSRGGIFWYQHCSVLSRDSHVLNKQCSDLMGNFQYKEQLSRQNLSRRMYALIAQRGSDHWSCPELKTFNDMSVTWRFRQKRPDFRFLSCTDYTHQVTTPLSVNHQIPMLRWYHGPVHLWLISCTALLCAALACWHHFIHLVPRQAWKLEASTILFSICTANPAPPVITKVLWLILCVSHESGFMPASYWIDTPMQKSKRSHSGAEWCNSDLPAHIAPPQAPM